MQINKMVLGKRIKQLREQRQFSQKELGSQLLKTQQAIDAWERGVAVPTTGVLIALADIFEVSVDYLLGRSAVKTLSTVDSLHISLAETIDHADLSADTKRMIMLLLESEQLRKKTENQQV